jgi:hypothetical protein
MHQYLHYSIQQFNIEDEIEFKNRVTSIKNDFSFSQYKLEPIFNECKFKGAILEIKKISTVTVPFEKMVKFN